MPKNTLTLPPAATRPLYAGVGVTDLVAGAVRGYVADVSRSVSSLDAGSSRRAVEQAVEQGVARLQSDALGLPARLQRLYDRNVAVAGQTFDELVERGEGLVGRVRGQESTQRAVAAAQTTRAKARTTRTQAASTATSARKSAAKTARKSPARSSAKATATSAKKTAGASARAVKDTAKKTGA